MKNFEKMKTEEFLKEVRSYGLLPAWATSMVPIYEDKPDPQNIVHVQLWDKVFALAQSDHRLFDTEESRNGDNRLFDCLNDYIGPSVPISAQELSAYFKRICAYYKKTTYKQRLEETWPASAGADCMMEVIVFPMEEWAERIVEQVRASEREAA